MAEREIRLDENGDCVSILDDTDPEGDRHRNLVP